jgi:aminoglycoside phosphotransferase (APT) family kinase protein
MAHQTNRLYDVRAGDRHLIAKEYLSPIERDGPAIEYTALRLVQPLDVAPQPVFFDPAVGRVVVYAFLEGQMWDQRIPSAAELEALADLWVRVTGLPTDGLWVAPEQARAPAESIARLRGPIERYAVWAARQGAARREAARVCITALERGLADGVPLIAELAPLSFCRSDARFANVIARPDGRPGLVDWEDSGLRDPARELVDLLHHPNQEDLLGPDGWQPFLDRFLPSRAADPGARGLAWPSLDPTEALGDLAEIAFFQGPARWLDLASP